MSLSLNNSTIVPLLSGEVFLGKSYDNILDFAEINIAIKCDTGYDLTYIYSQDKLTIDYQTTQSITAEIDTQFYKIPVIDRYFKLKIEATDGNMSVLNVQTIYKSNITFNYTGSGPSTNASITSPLNGDGSVFVGGNLTLAGSVDANITNTSLDVAVSNFPASQVVEGSVDANITNTSLDVAVSNFPASQDVNITNTSLDVAVSNFPASQPISGSVDANITNTSLDVAVSNFPASQDVNITNTSLDVAVSNFPATQAVSNGSLASMSFDTNRLNVIDSDANTKLTNIYNVVNSRGGIMLRNGDIDADGTTSSLNLSNVNVKNLTIYGNQDSNGNILTLQFSFDGTNFFKSQYSYSFGASVSGNFGFNVQCCPKYVRIQSANLCTLTLFVDYC